MLFAVGEYFFISLYKAFKKDSGRIISRPSFLEKAEGKYFLDLKEDKLEPITTLQRHFEELKINLKLQRLLF